MTRITFVAFAMLTGFFYVTGKPIEESSAQLTTFADLSPQKSLVGYTSPRTVTEPVKHTSPSRPAAKYFKTALADNPQTAPAATASHTSMAAPEIPIRNPRRADKAKAQYASLMAKPATPTNTEPGVTSDGATAVKSPEKTNKVGVFGEARTKQTDATIKPLAVSYQQRFAKPRKPVLGPRLTAVLVKRELRRVGCYSGNVTSNWDEGARNAVAAFNINADTTLATGKPTVNMLERLQQITSKVCKNPAINGTVIANRQAVKTKSLRKTTSWRTKIQRRKATYRRAPSTVGSGYKSVGHIGLAETYATPQTSRVKRNKIARKHRARRAKKIRITKRKARRKTAVRSWKRTYRRKRFGFKSSNGSFSLEN